MKTTTPTLALMLAFVALPVLAGWADQAEIEGDMEEAERALARFASNALGAHSDCEIKTLNGFVNGIKMRPIPKYGEFSSDNMIDPDSAVGVVMQQSSNITWDIDESAGKNAILQRLKLDPLICRADGICDGYAYLENHPVVIKFVRDDLLVIVMTTIELDNGNTVKTFLVTRTDYLSCN